MVAMAVDFPERGEDNDVAIDEATLCRRIEKNRKKKEKKKRAKQRRIQDSLNPQRSESPEPEDKTYNDIPEFELKGAFQRFKITYEEEGDKKGQNSSGTDVVSTDPFKSLADMPLKARAAAILAEEPILEPPDPSEPNKMGKKRMKLLTRLSVAALKQDALRPDVVEMWDVCSRDPKLLVYMKAYRNTVPVPRHWCAKRKYLQGKRGIEKPPFQLPEFIARTGIMEMRQAVQDKEAEKTMKQKMRERVRPKVGRVDIDYQKLHDAFFKHFTKPRMSIHGDLYYEGKEYEVKLKEKKPGVFSDELRLALGLPIGHNAEKFPPPWLIAMQRYGPPPSYPNLKIPGLNGAIPEGCSFGYHAGGWGKPPVDEHGRPIYGDVFGNGGMMAGVPPPPPPPPSGAAGGGEVEQEDSGKVSHWGELESDEEESEESEEEEEGDEEEEGEEGGKVTPGGRPVDVDTAGLVTPSGGLITPSGVSSVGAGLETPESIELRKKTIEEAMEMGGETPQLYRILPEVETSVGSAMMGSSKLYDVAGVTGAPRGSEVDDGSRRQPRKRSSQNAPTPSGSQSGAKSSDSGGTGTGDRPAKKFKEFKF